MRSHGHCVVLFPPNNSGDDPAPTEIICPWRGRSIKVLSQQIFRHGFHERQTYYYCIGCDDRPALQWTCPLPESPASARPEHPMSARCDSGKFWLTGSPVLIYPQSALNPNVLKLSKVPAMTPLGMWSWSSTVCSPLVASRQCN